MTIHTWADTHYGSINYTDARNTAGVIYAVRRPVTLLGGHEQHCAVAGRPTHGACALQHGVSTHNVQSNRGELSSALIEPSTVCSIMCFKWIELQLLHLHKRCNIFNGFYRSWKCLSTVLKRVKEDSLKILSQHLSCDISLRMSTNQKHYSNFTSYLTLKSLNNIGFFFCKKPTQRYIIALHFGHGWRIHLYMEVVFLWRCRLKRGAPQ